MAGTPVAKVRNSLLDTPVLSSDTKSSSTKTSIVTLVENDSDLGANHASKLDGGKVDYPSYHNSEYTWVDRFLGVFCVKRTEPSTKKKFFTPKASEWAQHSNASSEWPSPWILPVYVISKSTDEHKNTETKIAKCTIDTGNRQGNIVSRNFVETLGYPESSFRKLTREEQRGGTSITGDDHIPLGAVYLTWYHQNSSRVFRDMRFLVSPTTHFDLIIGARSIQKDNILNVPCLMVDPKTARDISFVPRVDQVEAEKQLNDRMSKATEEYLKKDEKYMKDKQKNPQADFTTHLNAIEERKDVKKFYKLLNDIFKIHQKNEEQKTQLSDLEKNTETDRLKSLKVLARKYEHGEIEKELRTGLKDPMWQNFWAILEEVE